MTFPLEWFKIIELSFEKGEIWHLCVHESAKSVDELMAVCQPATRDFEGEIDVG